MNEQEASWISEWLNRLPADFCENLGSREGCLAFHGYYRLLGVGGRSPYDLATWNEPQCWKFAWPSPVEQFFCVGFSAWGDQYVYDLRAPERGILLLEAYDLHAEPVARSWTELVESEFQRLDQAPYDVRVLEAFDKWGPLNWDEGLALIPPLLLAENEDACDVIKMNMRSVMIINGDVYSQLQDMPEDLEIAGVSTYVDALGRERLRLERPKGN